MIRVNRNSIKSAIGDELDIVAQAISNALPDAVSVGGYVNEYTLARAAIAALAAGTHRAETSETSAPSEGCQSGPNVSEGNAQ